MFESGKQTPSDRSFLYAAIAVLTDGAPTERR